MADILPPLCAGVKKSRGLNLLEPGGAVQACNGTALPYIIDIILDCRIVYLLVIPRFKGSFSLHLHSV
jgi:hypothetical protein